MPEQLTKTDLTTMTPQAIVQARRDGQLDELLGKPVPRTSTAEDGGDAPITLEDLATMSNEEIVAARKVGRLAHLM